MAAGNGSSLFREGNVLTPAEVGTGDRTLGGKHVRKGPLKGQLATVFPRLGTDLQHDVGRAHDGFIVFHHHHGISLLGQTTKDLHQPVDVAGMQPDRRFIEHKEGVDQRGAEAGSEVDPLGFAAGEGARAAVEREVAEADLFEVVQACEHRLDRDFHPFIRRVFNALLQFSE